MQGAKPMAERVIFLDYLVAEGRPAIVAIPVSELPRELAKPLLRQMHKPKGRIIRKPRLLEAHRLLYKYNVKDEIDFTEIDDSASRAEA